MSAVMEIDNNENVTAVKLAGSNQVHNIGTTWKDLSPTHNRSHVTFSDVPCDNQVTLSKPANTTMTMEGGCQLEIGPVIKIDSNILNNERQASTLPRRSRNRTKTWKDLSPTKEQKMSSSCGESPKTRKNEANSNQLVTWKDLSPTKEPPSPERKNRRKKRPESGYFSNDVQSDVQESREGIDVSLSESEGNHGKAYGSSPEDGCFNNDYFYDEDFIVQFDTNIRDGSVPRSDGEPEPTLPFPHSLTGSYTRFGNLHDSQQDVFLNHYESELSGSRTSMEISSSEREMMCSSDMLDFSSDPLFTPTPTAEPVPQHYSIDSLGRSHDGRLAINCQPKKHEYFLSFNESQSHCTASESENSFASQSSSQGGASNSCSPSCSSNGEETEEICSNSFHFCQMHKYNDVSHRVGRAYRPGSHQRSCSLGAVLERSPEKSSSSDIDRRHSSKSSSSSRSHSCGSLRSPARSPSCYKLSSLCDAQSSQEIQYSDDGHDPPPTYMTSWKHVKSLRKLGKLGNALDTSRCNSLPDLSQPVQPRRLERAQKLENLQLLADSFHSKRHSASLLDLYQRMQCSTNPVSPDTMKTIEQILFPPNGVGDDYLLSVSRTGLEQDDMSEHDSELCGCGNRGLRLNIPSEVGPGISASQESRSTPSYRSHSTGISPDTVILWHGTKNFASQFPPKTSDCGIQTSIETKDTMFQDHSMQTSPSSPKKDICPEPYDLYCRESRKEERDPVSSPPRRCVSAGEIKAKRTKSMPNFRRSASLSPSRIGKNCFYTHNSLPDLSFLAARTEASHSSSSLFDPVQIPIILRPVIDDSQQTQSRSQCPSCACHDRRGQGHPRTELGSSSSGISSSSSGDHVYGEPRRCTSLAADLERILFSPPHLESVPRSASVGNRVHLPQHKTHANEVEHKLSRYTYEMHPGKAPVTCPGNLKSKPVKRTLSCSSSSSSSSLNVEGLYALTEEQSPTSPEKSGPSWFEQQGFNKTNLKYFSARELYGDQWDSDDNDSFTVEIFEQFVNERKPLKSCLRKKVKDCRSRSLSNPDSLCSHGDIIPPKKPNRHSIACDGIFPQLVDEEQFENAQIECIRNFCDEGLPPPELLKEEAEVDLAEIVTSCSSSDEDPNKANKRVSFASEVSFHSPQYTPTNSPKRPPTPQGPDQVVQNDEDLTLQITQTSQNTTVQMVQQPVLANNGPEKPPRVMHGSASRSHDFSPQPIGRSPSAEFAFEIARKRAVLISVAQAAEALVTHFALARDPFDKLRLGSSAENPEISKMVVSLLCPAVEQVVEDGMKSFLTGFHVFGKTHITSWKVAEMSSEIGPYTRAVNELVKQLKLKQNLISNKQKFYAFIIGLLNLRLLDFWMGYVRSKKNITDRVYSPGSILALSQSHLERGYDDMLLALQPLAVLPFQLEFEIVMPSADSIKKSSSDNAFGFNSLPRDYGRQKAERKLSESYSKDDNLCEKGLNLRLFGSATFPRSRSSLANMTTFKGSNSDKKSLLPPSPTRMPGTGSMKSIQNNQVMELKQEDREDHEQRPSVITAPVSSITNLAAKFLQRSGSLDKWTRSVPTECSFANGKNKQTSLDSSDLVLHEGRHVVLDGRQAQESLTMSTSTSQTSMQPKQSPRNSFNIISFFDKLLLPDKMTPKSSVTRMSWTEGQRTSQELTEANRWVQSLSSKQETVRSRTMEPEIRESQELDVTETRERIGTKEGTATCLQSDTGSPADAKLKVKQCQTSKVGNVGTALVTMPSNQKDETSATECSESLPSVLREAASASPAPASTRVIISKDRLNVDSRTAYPNVDINANSPDFQPEHYAIERPSAVQNQELQAESAENVPDSDPVLCQQEKAKPVEMEEPHDPDQSDEVLHHEEQSEPSDLTKESSSDTSPDSFHSTTYRYVVTMATCNPEEKDHMTYDGGEYLEVLAQLDADWLYCANGKCEGLVRLQAVQPITEEDMFRNLHDNFYR